MGTAATACSRKGAHASCRRRAHRTWRATGGCNCGILQQFTPVSETTWWAVIEGNLTGEVYFVRTDDSGRTWQDVSPAPGQGGDYYFMNAYVAWVQEGDFLYRTLDGGKSWYQLGRVQDMQEDCQLDFVDIVHGFCTYFGAASDSMTVFMYSTANGGATWSEVSQTEFPGGGRSSPEGLPWFCDKSVTFTSPEVGWAEAGFCNVSPPYIYTTTDGGHIWHPLERLPLPPRATGLTGEGFGGPVVKGSDVAIMVNVDGTGGAYTEMATSSDDGSTWLTQSLPGPHEYPSVDLIDPRDWVISYGSVLQSTDNAGSRWRTFTLPRAMWASSLENNGLTLTFLSPLIGWATAGSGTNGPIWWTTDGGASWRVVVVQAGPYKV